MSFNTGRLPLWIKIISFYCLETTTQRRTAVKNSLKRFELPCNEGIISEYSVINLGFWKRLELSQITKEELKRQRFVTFCEHFSFDVDPEKMAKAYMEELSEQSYLKDGAQEICEKLFEKCRMYIITNGIKFIQTKRFSNTSIKKYFENVFISEEIGFEKPSIEYFETVANNIPNFDKKNTLVVGDSLTSDIQGGINFGLDTCWFNPLGKKAPKNMDITYQISELDEIYDIVTV